MSGPRHDGILWVPVSWGELLDKITILEVKRERIVRNDARANVVRELALLEEIAAPVLGGPQVGALIRGLKRVNERLWDIEDGIRLKEAAAEFDAEFIRLARAVYRTNDDRAGLKRRINALLGSGLVEEKSYAGWLSAAAPVGRDRPEKAEEPVRGCIAG